MLLTVALWPLASYLAAPAGAVDPAIGHSYAGQIGNALKVLFAPLGFNWQISVTQLTGMALLAWYIFAHQCLSTLVAIHRESGGWKMPVTTVLYQLALAYGAAFVTFRLVSLWWRCAASTRKQGK